MIASRSQTDVRSPALALFLCGQGSRSSFQTGMGLVKRRDILSGTFGTQRLRGMAGQSGLN
jgi:hypothetical protein